LTSLFPDETPVEKSIKPEPKEIKKKLSKPKPKTATSGGANHAADLQVFDAYLLHGFDRNLTTS